MSNCRWPSRIGAAAVLVVGLLCEPAPAEPPDDLSSAERASLFAALAEEAEALEARLNVVKTVVKLASPSVVHIEWQKRRAARPGGRTVQIEEAGSGVIVRLKDQFFVVTNWHVIRDAEIKDIKILLADGRRVTPLQRWWDQATDVAVVAVEEADLVAAQLGDSDRLEIGDFVLAVGSPFGLSHSVTYGIISAKGRRDLELPNDDLRYQDFLQTDAAINPGNSGGPLFNLRGEVIGINTAIASSSGGNEGIGFTIPINMVMTVARQLVDRGRVVRAYLGVTLDVAFGQSAAARLGLPRPRGARITGVRPNSGAATAGLQVDDVILEFNHVAIDDDVHLVNVVSLTEVGNVVPVVILRDHQEMTVDVQVGNREQQETPNKAPSKTPAAPGALEQSFEDSSAEEEAWDVAALGLTLVELADLKTVVALSAKQGLYVRLVAPAGPAGSLIKVGDVLDRIDQTDLRQIDDLEAALSDADSGREVAVHVVSPGGASRTIRLKLGDLAP